jgi:small Trp-rich protein
MSISAGAHQLCSAQVWGQFFARRPDRQRLRPARRAERGPGRRVRGLQPERGLGLSLEDDARHGERLGELPIHEVGADDVELHLLEVGVVATWSWLVVLSPFGLAVVWWAWADWSGYTKKKAMDKMDKRKQARIDKQREAIGTGIKRRR